MDRSRRRVRPVSILCAILLLLALWSQVITSSIRQSLTADEPVSISAGYSYWTTGDWRLQKSVAHPPLFHLWASWPLLLRPIVPVSTLPGWNSADLSRVIRELVPLLGPPQATALAVRVPNMWLALVLGALAWRWATDLAGPRAGFLALAFLAFDPNLIAHAQLATTDVGLALACLAAVYGLWRVVAGRRWAGRGAWLLCGGAAGAAIAVKSSGALILPILGLILFLFYALEDGRPFLARMKRAAWQWAVLAALAGAVVWTVYRFEVLPLPLATYWEVMANQAGHATGGQRAFLMGQISEAGWWYYYPVVLAIKTPLPTLILMAVAGVLALRAGLAGLIRSMIQEAAWLWILPLVLLASAIQGHIDLGYRLLLPALPFVIIGTACCVSCLPRRTFVVVSAALAIWLVGEAASIYPYHLAYFNELAGGPDKGYRWLVDSNLDWGQWALDLGQYAREQGLDRVNTSHYSFVEPSLYGVPAQPIAPARKAPPVLPARFDPAPGVYAIGATTLQGIMVADPDTYSWFQHHSPAARLGHALFVYRVTPRSQPFDWVAQCTVPSAPLEPDQVQEGWGRAGLRQIYFDCSQSWIVPAGSPGGWYVVHQDAPRAPQDPAGEWLNQARLSFDQRSREDSPALQIYEADSLHLPVACSGQPVEIGPVSLLGYTARADGRALNVQTCWRVTSRPSRPLSLMLHVAGPDGSALAVADGLGVPVEQWQPGDVIMQYHTAPLQPDAPLGEYRVWTGAYWLDTLERLPVGVGGAPARDQVELGRVTVDVKHGFSLAP